MARYIAAGYRIIQEPSPEFAPPVHGYTPDFIAVRGSERVAVEVKARASVAEAQGLQHIASEFSHFSGWRLDLFVGSQSPSPSSLPSPIDKTAIKDRVFTADLVAAERHDYSVASLLLWTAVEAVLRHLLSDYGTDMARLGPRMAKTALSDGLITDDEFVTLERLANIRNQVVHGGPPTSKSTPEDYLAFRRVVLRLVRRLHPKRRPGTTRMRVRKSGV